MGHKLRPYQREAVEAVFDALADGHTRLLYTLPVGGGKTVVMAELVRRFLFQKKKVLILAHRVELIDQTYARVKEYCDLDVWDIGTEIGSSRATQGQAVIVGSIQTCYRPHRLPEKWEPDVIIVDECFPKGTLVSGKPIEQYNIGDPVLAYDHKAGRVVESRVTRLFKNPVKHLVRVTLEDGRSVVCTPGHPILCGHRIDRAEYIPAYVHSSGCVVHCIEEEANATRNGVQGVREEVSGKEQAGGGAVPRVLLEGVQGDGLFRETQEGDDELPLVRERSRVLWKKRAGSGPAWKGVLLGLVQRLLEKTGIGSHYCGNKSKVCVRKNEDQQPHAPRGCQGADADYDSGDGLEASCAGRERQGSNGSTAASGMPIRVGYGSLSRYEAATGQWVSDVLQDRHRQFLAQNRGRGGWVQPQGPVSKTDGHQEDRVPYGVRVDHIEILEPGCDGTFGGVCPDGFVYNIEVEGHHNYFANGILVHNCHRSAAPSYRAIATRFGVDAKRCVLIGCTATAKRTDKQSLYALDVDGKPVMLERKGEKPSPASLTESVFEKHAYDFTLLDAIEGGWLVPMRGVTVESRTDISGTKTTAGDFNQKELSGKVDNTERTLEAIAAWKRVADGRQTLVFCASVEHAHHAAELWQQAGYRAKAVDGETDSQERFNTFADFKRGELDILCNMGVATEGTDLPSCSCIVHLRPTKSWGLFMQMTGRASRPWPGVLDAIQEADPQVRIGAIAASPKPDSIIIDVVDIYDKCGDLCTIPSILDLPVKLDLQGHSILEAKKLLDEFEAEERKGRILAACPTNYHDLEVLLTDFNLMRNSGAASGQKWKMTDWGYRFTGMAPGYVSDLVKTAEGFRLEVSYKGSVFCRKSAPQGKASIKGYLDHAALYATQAAVAHSSKLPPSPTGVLAKLSPKQIGVLRRKHTLEEIATMKVWTAKKLIADYVKAWKKGDGG